MLRKQAKQLEKLIIVIFFIADFCHTYKLLTGIDWLYDFIKYLGLLLSLFYWFIYTASSCRWRTLMLQIIVGTMILYTSIESHNFSYIITYCMIMIAKEITVREYVKLCMTCLFVQLFLAIILWVLSPVFGLGIPFYYNEYNRRISFGLGHPNNLSMKIIWCGFSYMLLATQKNMRKRIIILCMALLFGIYITKSSAVVFGIVMVLLYICKNKKFIVKSISFIAKFIFPILGILLYTIVYFYDKTSPLFLVKMSKKIDTLSNFRIAMSAAALKYNNFTWFGSDVTYEGHWESVFQFGRYTIDILYIVLFVSVGIMYFIVISYGFYILAKKGNYMVSLAIVMFSLCGLAELSVLYITTSFVLTLFKIFVFKNESIEKLFLSQ